MMQTAGTALHYMHDTQDTPRLESSKLAALRRTPHAEINPRAHLQGRLLPAFDRVALSAAPCTARGLQWIALAFPSTMYFVRCGFRSLLFASLLLTHATILPSAAQQLDNASARPVTAEADLLREMEAAVAKGGYEQAVAMLKAKVHDEPLNVAAHFFLATAYQTKQDYVSCIEQARTAERARAVDDRLLGILWVCLHESGQDEDALKTATEAIARFPRSGESHRWYGLSMLGQKRYADARSHLQDALRLDPTDATSLYILAQLYRRGGDLVPSLLTYLRFFAVEPGGDRAQKAREQLKALLAARLVLSFTNETQVKARLSVGDDGPTDEGDFREAQRAMAVYASATRQEPELTAPKLAKTVEKVLDAMPPPEKTSGRSFTFQVLVPYFAAIQSSKLINGLAEVVLPQKPDRPSEEALKFLQWSAEFSWPEQ